MIGLSIGIGLTRVIGQGGAANPIIVSPGSIDAQPLVGQVVLVTEPEVTGATSTAYQWYDGDPVGSGTPISGWTGATPTPTDTQYALSAPIWRRATYTNDAGSVIEDMQAPAVVGFVWSDDFVTILPQRTAPTAR